MPTTLTWRRVLPVVIIVIFGAALFGIIPQLSGFKDSLQAIQTANRVFLAGALAAVIVAYICAAGLYQLLSYKALRFRNTLLVQIAGLFVNRVLPAGIGGLGLNFLYLRKQRHSAAQAGTIVGLNNLLGFVGHMLLLAIIIVLRPQDLRALHLKIDAYNSVLYTGLALVVVALVGGVIVYVRRQKRTSFKQFTKQLALLSRYYRTHPRRLAAALVTSCGLTLSNVLGLWLCCQAVGIDLNFAVIFFIFTAGIFLGTAIPSPGGLGGTEAALVGGLVLQHVDSGVALAAVLAYRLLSFWLGLAVGAVALVLVNRRQLLA